MDYSLDEWWAGLSVAQKERVAGKVKGAPAAYPECTAVWNALAEDERRRVREHCEDRHGMTTEERAAGGAFSY